LRRSDKNTSFVGNSFELIACYHPYLKNVKTKQDKAKPQIKGQTFMEIIFPHAC
jgi:hypothetical protein